jgi:hypothetical protein
MSNKKFVAWCSAFRSETNDGASDVIAGRCCSVPHKVSTAFDLLVHAKRHLSGQRFLNDGDDDDDTVAMTTYLQALEQNCFAKGFSTLVFRSKKSLKRCGNDIEK